MNRILPKSLEKHWNDPKGLIQVFLGPRQVGKTTTATRLMKPAVTVYASADTPTPPTVEFIESKWNNARRIDSDERTLILDEIQKIPRWSEIVKNLWDEDKRERTKMRVCILGSSALLIEKGLSESLAGRFEVNYFPHWTYAECRRCFNISPEQYALVGGYPKAYDFLDDTARLENYIYDSILEPTLGRDVLSLHAIDKPALLRQLFWYVSRVPSQIVSYDKILGHLQGKGNAATLVRYAELLNQAFLLCPLSKFSGKAHRTKRSIPKWIIPNPGLVETSVKRAGLKDFVFENLVGSHLLNLIYGRKDIELRFWREEPAEVDFVMVRFNEPILAFEAKSGRVKNIPDEQFLRSKGIACPLKVISRTNLEEFLSVTEVEEL